MNIINDEVNQTIINGWTTNKTPQEVSDELIKFDEYLKQTMKLFNASRRKAKKQKSMNVK